jgi:hypothetical protein
MLQRVLAPIMGEITTGTRDFFLLRKVQTGSGAHPVCGAPYPGAKQHRHEAYHSKPSVMNAKNGEAVPQLPPYIFMALFLIIGKTLTLPFTTLLLQSVGGYNVTLISFRC